ncbi:hypothetical protein, partial [Novacetimonas hansenii]|uniref:hypothetical protein n=1 Tax=Novacetimonas hansenii TaxID=436 RepID=UPI0039EC0071
RRLLKLFRKSFTKNFYNFTILSDLAFQIISYENIILFPKYFPDSLINTEKMSQLHRTGRTSSTPRSMHNARSKQTMRHRSYPLPHGRVLLPCPLDMMPPQEHVGNGFGSIS